MKTNPKQIGIPFREACARIPCSIPTGYRLIEAGLLRTFTVGNRRFVTEQFLEEFVATMAKRSAVRHIRAPRAHQETVDAIDHHAEA